MVASHFSPPEVADGFITYRNHAMRLWEQFHDASDPLDVKIFPLPRLFSRNLEIADVILDHLPEQPSVTDHGAGYCLVFAVKGESSQNSSADAGSVKRSGTPDMACWFTEAG
ncbi:MAG: hypothetical protein FWD68_19120 [Alphaproteobacteria bacterium]|nr:hypothetical protein [Alphaproteobacteria bacterium]